MSKLFEINKRGERADFSWLSDLEKIFKTKFRLKRRVSIALVSLREIRELNRVYRRRDKVTDVLSFVFDSPEMLGEVIICPAQARRDASAAKNTLKFQLQLLTTHGILHLLGYDHEKSLSQEQKQQRAESQILTLLNK